MTDQIALALKCLQSGHVQDNLHRLGALGAEDVRTAVGILQELEPPKQQGAVRLGRKGGKAKTPAQQTARSDNLKKARDNRWPKKEK